MILEIIQKPSDKNKYKLYPKQKDVRKVMKLQCDVLLRPMTFHRLNGALADEGTIKCK